MPFKDLPEGQTNYDPQAELEARIDKLVRDTTKVGSIPKSEVKRRIWGILALERLKIYHDLIAVADAGEYENMRREVDRYFNS